MKKLIRCALLSATVLSTACGDHDELSDGGAALVDSGLPGAVMDGGVQQPGASSQALTLKFAAKVGSAPFACGSSYMMGKFPVPTEPLDLRFYVHALELVDRAGKSVQVTLADSDFQRMGVGFLDFENGTGRCTQGDALTNAELRGTVPAGDYVGLRFRVGIPFELNHKDITALPSPLNRTSLFWSWKFGHIFFASATRSTTSADGGVLPTAYPDAGMGEPPPGEHYTHLGSFGCEGDPAMGIAVTSCSKPNRPLIVLDGFNPATNTVVVDVGALKGTVDITSDLGCHSFTDTCAFPFDALGLNYATGSETPTTQKTFRVE